MRLTDKIKSWFQPRLVYVDRPSESPIVDDPAVIATLASHPGFLMLLSKLKKDRQLLEARLRSERFKDMREVDSLQSGLHWLTYLEDTIRKATNAKMPVYTVPDPDTRSRYIQMLNNIESV